MKSIKPLDEGKRNYVPPEKALENIAKMPKVEQPLKEDLSKGFYKNLDFEESVIDKDSNKKKVCRYDQSLLRLRKAGYERHALPWEAFDLIIERGKGNLNDPRLEKICREMNEAPGEWCSMAFKCSDGKLTVYLHPEGLVFNPDEQRYVEKNFKCNDVRHFDVADKVPDKWDPLREFSNRFMEAVYGRSSEEMPLLFLERSLVKFPIDGLIWPVSINMHGFGSINISSGSFYQASRGVKRKR